MIDDPKNPNSDTDPLLPTQQEYQKRADKLAAFLRSEPKPKKSWFRRPGGVASVAAGALLVSVGVAGAAGLFSADDVAVGAGINCYSKASLDSESVGLQPQKNPVMGCEQVWNDNALETADFAGSPELVACATKGSPVDVFPGGPETCESLGLEVLPEGYASLAQKSVAIEKVLHRVSNVVEHQACVNPDDLYRKATQALRAAGFTDRIDLIGTKPCANYATSIGTGKLRIETISRHDSLNSFELMRALKVKEQSFPTRGCTDPLEYQAKLQTELAARGLSDVAVLIDDKTGDCLDLTSGMGNSEDPSITLMTKADSSKPKERNGEGNSTETNQGMTLDHPTDWSATFDGHDLFIKVQCPDQTRSCAVTAAAAKKGFSSQFGEPVALKRRHSGIATSVVKRKLRGSFAREANAEGSIPFEYRATTDDSSGTHVFRTMLRVNWQSSTKPVGAGN